MNNWPEWTKQIPGIAIGLILGAIILIISRQPGGEPVRLAERPTQAHAVAYIVGEVINPGVYEFQPGMRVDDLISRAGGPSSRADLSLLNLASMVTDGQKITVPAFGDPPVAVENAGKTAPLPGLIDINTADMGELTSLPGIGEDRANAILSYREAHGGFRSIEEIQEVNGIGKATFEEIKHLITVSAVP